MTDVKQVNNSGIGFLGLLTLLFIGLKLTGYITWSWWWVLAPAWIPFAIFFIVFAWIFARLMNCSNGKCKK